jgi:methylenetetrahydrofolate dehydrogenase (NADP+)/methenyltetrahydrofolate cyclohydrolase
MYQLIDGKSLANKYLEDFRIQVEKMVKCFGRKPGLAVILVGNDPASSIYVGRKEKACKFVGINSYVKKYDSNISEGELICEINNLNSDNSVDGILIQLPLPSHIKPERVINQLLPHKDVDGFHPINMGNLFLGYDSFIPCTPNGIIKMLEYYNIDLTAKKVVIIGRSNIVGKPLIPLFLRKDALVTVCHSKILNLSEITIQGDIIVSAIGKPNYIRSNFVKKGAVVIDVGISKINDKITGDVCFEEVSKLASFITPVPGGVGPMTIAMLINNTLKAYQMHQ